MNEHSRRMLRKVNTKIKLLSRVRHSLMVLPTKAVYTSFIFRTMLYCSTPIVKISDTMTKKFDSIQRRAQKVIYGLQEANRSEHISINNHKKIEMVIQMFTNVSKEPLYMHLEVMQTA